MHEFGSVKLELVLVCPPQVQVQLYRVPALISTSNDFKNRLLYYGAFIVYMYGVYVKNYVRTTCMCSRHILCTAAYRSTGCQPARGQLNRGNE